MTLSRSRWLPVVGASALVGALALNGCTHLFLTPIDRRCFATHLEEAVAKNLERRPLYAARSDGASTAISDRLIAAENAMLPMAIALDRLDVEIRTTGLCEMFEPMASAPAYRPTAPTIDEPFHAVDVDAMVRDLRQALDEAPPEAVAATAERALAGLEGAPGYHCMLRHMLESVRRAANVTSRHRHEVAAGRSRDAEELYTSFIALHLDGLSAAADLDRDAAPLQQAGVAIICDDVPPIPPWPAASAHRASR